MTTTGTTITMGITTDMDWPEHPFVSQRTARRIFGRRNLASHASSDANSLWPSQHFTVTAPISMAVKLTCSSEMEQDDNDEDAQHDYRKAKVVAEYDPSKPYSRYHATRLAQRLRRAAGQARQDLLDTMGSTEQATTYPTFFEGTVVEAAAQKKFVPQRYRQWGPFAQHPPRFKLPEL